MIGELTLNGVTVVFNQGRFNETVALRDVTLRFCAGEHVLIIGPNGSGKSTLLNVIDGRVRPAKGTVAIDGAPCDHLQPHERAHFVYRLFQNTLLGVVPVATIAENLALARMRGRTPRLLHRLIVKKDRQFHQDAIRLFRPGLADRLDEKVFRLSPGERQALTLALLQVQATNRTGVLLADEPTAALDPQLAKQCMHLLDTYAAQGWLCLVVTHDERMIQAHAGRVVRLDGGAVVSDKGIRNLS